ncbi:Phage-related DNA transposition protein(B) [uncultured Alphaproteobacteria bacterium]|uniref:Phage-related DNA transposition protein(B) n=1 Tax=uncultured Alphaproteobacteria bacterium TaxID=91750 RepID=A0A212KC61_9PROT|nr:Phage-related DNA transposition protein(B) [uncultured Alphaproteobacteria bacterium]
MSRHRDTRTYELLSWQPPEPAQAFEPEKVRAASLRTSICRALAVSLKDCGKEREEIAAEIGKFLGEPCSKAMLDAYASEAREDQVISLLRFLGLIHATHDIRLMQVLAEMFDWAVVPAKYLPAIEESIIADKIEELTQRRSVVRKLWKGA